MKIDQEAFDTIMFCAFRYALGRKSYITNTISYYIIGYWKDLNRRTRIQIQEEIRTAIWLKQAGFDCDVKEWEKILELE
jgi:hypothetical protein